MYRLTNTLKQVFNTPQLLNTVSSIRHEYSFEQILIFEGISKYNVYNNDIHYKRYPLGKNKFPDFMIYYNNNIIPIELKLSVNSSVNIGSTWIKSNGIYIISHNSKTFISLGKDMVTEDEHKMFNEYSKELNEMRRKYNTTGISLYPRTNIKYPILYSKYEQNYKNVINYLNSL